MVEKKEKREQIQDADRFGGIDMEKVIDLSKSVFELCKEYPEVIAIMRELGFDNIAKPNMLNTVGRVMTLEKGSVMKGIDLDIIKEVFKNKGFIIK